MSDPLPEQRTRGWGDAQRSREREILSEMYDLPEDDARRQSLRGELVTMHLPLVNHPSATTA